MDLRPIKNRVDAYLHHSFTESVLIGLIVASAGLILLETWSEHSNTPHAWIHRSNSWILELFCLELGLRFWITRRKSRFFRNYWLDLISVVPLFSSLRLLQILSLLRLFRAGALLNRSFERHSLPTVSQLGVVPGLAVLLLLASLSMYLLEGDKNPSFDTMEETLWWSALSIIAAEPVGGEPQTAGGKLVALFIMLGGVTMFAVLTGVTSAIMVQRLKSGMEVRDMELEDLRDHIVICGWSRGVPLILEELQHSPGFERRPIVIVAEFGSHEFPVRELKRGTDRDLVYFHSGDFTAIDVLEKIGIHHASYAILIADHSRSRSDQDRDARTVLAALTIEKLNPKIFTCAQLLNRKNNVHLRVAGVEEVVVGDEVSSHLIASSIRNHGLTDVFMELLTIQIGNEFYKMQLPKIWEGMAAWDVMQLLKKEHDSILVAIERWEQGHRLSIVNPAMQEKLRPGDHLVIIAKVAPRLG